HAWKNNGFWRTHIASPGSSRRRACAACAGIPWPECYGCSAGKKTACGVCGQRSRTFYDRKLRRIRDLPVGRPASTWRPKSCASTACSPKPENREKLPTRLGEEPLSSYRGFPSCFDRSSPRRSRKKWQAGSAPRAAQPSAHTGVAALVGPKKAMLGYPTESVLTARSVL